MNIIRRDEIQNHIGKAIPATDWFTVTQEQITQFADCTLDHQFIHVDEERARETPFGSTIAHGLLSLSMLPYFAASFAYMIEGMTMGINYGFDKVRFLNPVKVNSRIRAHAKLIEFEEKRPGQFIFKTDVSIEIEGEEKPALKAVWIAMQLTNA